MSMSPSSSSVFSLDTLASAAMYNATSTSITHKQPDAFTVSTPPLTPTMHSPSPVLSPVSQRRNPMSIASLLNDDFEQETQVTAAATQKTQPAPTANPIRYQSKLHYQRPKSLSSPYSVPSASSVSSASSAKTGVTHHEVENHSCNVCKKVFGKKHHLKSHLLTHSKEYSFSCVLNGCVSKFRRNQDLQRHLKTVKH